MRSGRASRQVGVVGETGFASRLDAVCDESGIVPAHNHGRQTWLRQRLADESGIRVSGEAVSKWFAGETVPRLATLKQIARLLGTDWPVLLDSGVALPRNASRSELDEAVEKAAQGQPTVIHRDGSPRAVVIAFDEWQRLSAVPSFGRLLMSAPVDAHDLSVRTSTMRQLDL